MAASAIYTAVFAQLLDYFIICCPYFKKNDLEMDS